MNNENEESILKKLAVRYKRGYDWETLAGDYISLLHTIIVSAKLILTKEMPRVAELLERSRAHNQPLEILQQLPFSKLAVLSGHTKILKWARDHGCPIDAKAIQAAAALGNLEMFQLCTDPAHVRRDWVLYDTSTFFFAVQGGNLQIVKQCHLAKCPYDWRVSAAALYKGHLDIVEYLYEIEVPAPKIEISVHQNCAQFMEIYGRSWQTGAFDVPLLRNSPKSAKT